MFLGILYSSTTLENIEIWNFTSISGTDHLSPEVPATSDFTRTLWNMFRHYLPPQPIRLLWNWQSEDPTTCMAFWKWRLGWFPRMESIKFGDSLGDTIGYLMLKHVMSSWWNRRISNLPISLTMLSWIPKSREKQASWKSHTKPNKLPTRGAVDPNYLNWVLYGCS